MITGKHVLLLCLDDNNIEKKVELHLWIRLASLVKGSVDAQKSSWIVCNCCMYPSVLSSAWKFFRKIGIFCLQKGWFVERWGFLVMGLEEVKKKTKNPFVALFRTSSAFWERQCVNFLGIFVWLVMWFFYYLFGFFNRTWCWTCLVFVNICLQYVSFCLGFVVTWFQIFFNVFEENVVLFIHILTICLGNNDFRAFFFYILNR